MSGRGTADVVFCIDASGSMGPCLEGVKRHITAFVETLASAGGQGAWDLRLDFLAHRSGGSVFQMETVYEDEAITALYGANPGRFFTTNPAEFSKSLARVSASSDETPFIALDTALDFPWRTKSGCHRIVVMLTDEPVETGEHVAESLANADAIVRKLMDLRVMLFLVSPESAGFERLAAADKAEWEVVEGGDGLRNVDFAKLLRQIAQSVSKSQAALAAPPAVRRALFGQDQWGRTSRPLTAGG